MPQNTIAFQGAAGANSDLACRQVFPEMKTLPCTRFEDAFAAVRDGRAKLAMIPIDNSVAGRVADIHHLLPDGGLHIIGEHFLRVSHNLLGPKGMAINDIREIRSHIHALSQCRKFITTLGATPRVAADTAGAAADLAAHPEPGIAVIASELAAEIYGLEILQAGIEDADHNTTRFLIMARDGHVPAADGRLTVTSFVFRVRNIPASLYKALGGFATNGVNMTKLESYMVNGHFVAAQFYAEIEGHPDDRLVRLALEELRFFAREVSVLGVFPAHPYRLEDRSRLGED